LKSMSIWSRSPSERNQTKAESTISISGRVQDKQYAPALVPYPDALRK